MTEDYDREGAVETDFNMSLQDLDVLDRARRRAEDYLAMSRYSPEAALRFVDALNAVYRVMLPALATSKQKKSYRARREKIEAALKDLRDLATRKQNLFFSCLNRGSAPVWKPAKFIEAAEKVFAELYIMKDCLGMGIKRSGVLGLKASIDRAAD